MIQAIEGNPSEGLIIDSVFFHEAVEDEVSSYMGRLRVGGNDNAELRDNFVIKMNISCGDGAC